MKSFRFVVTFIAALFTLNIQTHAATLVWTNTAGGAWSTAANWSPNAVPAAGDLVFITNSGTYTVSFNTSVNLASLTVGHTSATGLQQLSNLGGTLTVTNVSSASNGVIHLSSGTFTTAGTADLVGPVNHNTGTWQLQTPININIYNLTNAELRGANCVITNLNWIGGSLNSDAFGGTTTIPVGGTLNISGATGKTLSYYVTPGRTLINNGTGAWSGAGITGQGNATINNTGSLTLSGDFSFLWGGSGNAPVFINSGTLTKASGSGNFTLSTAILNNSGTVNIDSGSLNISGQLLNSGALNVATGTVAVASTLATSTNSGTLTLGANAFADFNSGATTLGGSLISPTANHLRFNGGTVNLNTTNITSPALLLAGATLNQNTNIAVNEFNQSAGTWQLNVPTVINNYNLTNGELRGANNTITNLNWIGGSLNSDALGNTTTVAAGGALNISSTTGKTLSYYVAPGRTLINNGTGVWSGAGITGQGGATIVNNATMTLAGDFSFAWGGAGAAPVFQNNTTLVLSNGSDFTVTQSFFNNQPGAGIYFDNASITIGSGSIATNSGLLNLNFGSVFQHSGATLTLGGAVVAPAANSLRFAGTTIYVNTTNLNTPSLWQQAGTVYQNTNVVVNTYNHQAGTFFATLPVAWNNYNMTNAEIRGANLTITNFNWLGGSLNADGPGSNTVTIPAGGTMNIFGATAKSLSYYTAPGRTLQNNGTATWSGAGITGQGGATIANNNTMTFAGDFSLAWGGAGNGPVFRNTSSLTLSNGSDFTLSTAILDNQASGTITFTNGSITVGSGSLATNSGTLNLDATSFFQFSGATLVLGGNVTAPGNNAFRFNGTSAYVTTTNIISPSYWLQGGTIYQQTNVVVNTLNQQNGTFYGTLPIAWNQYNMTNGELRGANVTITNFNWLGGALNSENANSNTVTIPPTGTLTISGATAKSLSDYSGGNGRRLLNQGAGTWSGAGISGSHGPQFNNTGTLDLIGDFSLVYAGGTGAPQFNNTGTLNLTSGADFTLSTAIFNNSSNVNVTAGSLNISASSIATNSGTLNLDATSFLQFSGATLVLGGTVVSPGNNSLRFNGTAAYVTTTGIASPSYWLQGGTIYQQTNVVVNALNQQNGTFYGTLPVAWNQYNMTNGELRGANVTLTNFNWLGGALNSENAGSNTVTIPAGGTLNISSATAKSLSDYSGGNGRRLVHRGTGEWSGASLGLSHGARFINHGSLIMTNDSGLAFAGGTGTPTFENSGGTFTKTNGTGVATFSSVNVTNAGTFSIARGGFTVSGVFHQTSGNANLGTNFTASANVRIDAGTFAGRGNIAGTFFNNGLSSAGAPLGLITGTSWTNAATGTIRFEIGGTNPGTNFDQFRLTGPATVNGTADLALANGFVPVPGNTFTCIVTTARSGVFTNLTFSGGYEFSALYTSTTVVFRAENALPTVNLTVLNGNTQLVCNPFKLLATASDVGGTITNLSILQDGSTIASANNLNSVIGTGESDFPMDVTFVAQAIDDQGGKSWATQTVSLTTFPLHVLQLGGKRSNGVFKFCMVGETGSNYMVLATTNIAEAQTNWTALGLMENTNNIWRYYDNGTMTNRPYRFYRALQVP
jgi:hypothetical protein